MQSRLRMRSFTLVELLVVISIIAILAGLTLPALSYALNAAKKAQAQAMIENLTTGITAFNTDYGTWPSDPLLSGGTAGIDDSLSTTNAYQILTSTGNGTNLNTRATQYLSFTSKDLDKTPNPSQVVDPWWRTVGATIKDIQNYHIQVDSDYNNYVVIAAGPFAGQTNNAGVAIWDPGIPLSSTKTNGNPIKILKNW